MVGAYAATQESFAASGTGALTILALISLSLGVINLFPFLPLDGGHIFWAVAEKVRGRRISFSVMERSGFVGFALILVVFVIGMTQQHLDARQRRLRHPLTFTAGVRVRLASCTGGSFVGR